MRVNVPGFGASMYSSASTFVVVVVVVVARFDLSQFTNFRTQAMISDIIKELRMHVYGAIYGDDLLPWCPEELFLTVKCGRHRRSLTRGPRNGLSPSTSRRPSTRSSAYPTKEQRPTLKTEGEGVEGGAAGRGVGRVCLSLTKKLTSIKWGADTGRKLFTRMVRPVQEYGVQVHGRQLPRPTWNTLETFRIRQRGKE